MPDPIEQVLKTIEGIENSMTAFQAKANEEIKANGTQSTETKNAIDALGVQQREVADRLLSLEQNNSGGGGDGDAAISMGKQFTGSDAYSNFTNGSTQKARFEVQNNTATGTDATVAPDRKAGIVPGATQLLTLEQALMGIPTASNAVEYTREATFVNNAAAVAEGGAKPETDITFELKQMPVSTIAHWTKVSRQLADDAPALAAYINARMMYGVDQKAEIQIGAGSGVGQLSGLLLPANYTAHGIADAALGTSLKKLALIRKVIAQAFASGYPADAIMLNPIDFGEIEIDLFTATAGQVRININAAGQPVLFGLPVIQSVAITQDSFLVGSFGQAATVHNRQGVVVELSESDGDNFTKNLITVRAERRLAVTVETPAAIIGGDLTPL